MSELPRFQVIPVHQVPPEELEDASDQLRFEPSPSVLVVDDEPIIADTRAAIFSTWGFTTTTAYNAKSAVALAAELSPDLLLADVDLLGMSGVDLAVRIAKDAPRCKILLLVSPTSGEKLALARKAGLEFSTIAKPVQPSQLRAHIESLNIRVAPTPHSLIDLASFPRCLATQMHFDVTFDHSGSRDGSQNNRLSA